MASKPIGPGASLKLLTAARKLQGPWGMCIHQSAAFVFDVPGAVLVFGTFDHPGPAEASDPFIHCWAEYRGAVYAPTAIDQMGGTLRPMNREGYYEINGARDIHRLTRPELLRLDRQFGLKRSLRLNVPCRGGASFGGTLLDAAGVAWTDSGDGAVVPLETGKGE